MSARVAQPDLELFERHRGRLAGLAYRMLGSVSAAEDMVQEAYLRWHAADRGAVDEPGAYLAKTVARLCLDQLKSAQARRIDYVGPWLPEPLLEGAAASPEAAADLAHDLSVALLLTLERLSPLERAAFLLHDVFELHFAAVAETLGRSEAACRQLAARGRARVRLERPPRAVTSGAEVALAQAFLAASRGGEVAPLQALLAEDVVLWTDGGGRKAAALNPIHGPDKVARFFAGLVRKYAGSTPRLVRPATINGLPGQVSIEADGTLQATTLEFSGERIRAIYIVRNPDKLAHLAAELGLVTDGVAVTA